MKSAGYYLAAIFAYIIWGFFSLVLKPIENYGSQDILFYRVFTCGVLMVIIATLARRRVLKRDVSVFRQLPPKQKRNFILLNLGGGLLLTANWYSFIFVMNHVSVKATSLAYLVCPIETTLFAYFILKEALRKWQWAAVGLSAAGCIILSFGHLTDMLYSLIIASSYALYLVTQRKFQEFDRFLALSIHIIFSALVLLPFYPVFRSTVPADPVFYMYIGVIAIFFTILPLLMNLYALKGINSSTAGMLLNINPLIAFVLAIFYFGEKIDATQGVAYGVILLSVVLFNKQFLFPKPGKPAI